MISERCHSRAKPNTEGQKSSIKVLVVEDEGIIAKDIAMMILQLGHEVIAIAGTGPEALESISDFTVDLVLMDIKLRGPFDGIETAGLIRNSIDVPVVFLTAHADSETLARATRTQPFGYIVKPFSESSLRVAIEIGMQRHWLQQQGNKRQDWLLSALLSLQDAVIALDSNTRIAFFNDAAAELSSWDAATAQGRVLTDVFPLLAINKGDKQVKDCLTSGDPVHAPFQMRRSNGSTIALLCSFAPHRQAAAALDHGWILVLRDMSALSANAEDRPEGSQKVQSSEMRLQELSYALTNELREPVRNISCFAELLGRSNMEQLDQASKEYLEFIISGSRRLENQMSALRRFYLAGLVAIEMGSTADTAVVFQENLRSASALVKETGATITWDPLPTVAMAADCFHEIVSQLLSNAFQFRSERALHIHFSAVRKGPFWTFSLTDNGVGFDTDQSERIFQLFTKAHQSAKPRNGVGLSVCRRLIERAGGRIWAESMVGQGSTFYFTVPALPAQLEDQAPEP